MQSKKQSLLITAKLFLLILTLTSAAFGQADKEKFAAAAKIYDEAIVLYQQGTAESKRAALTRFEQALALFRQIGSKAYESATLLGIGGILADFGEAAKALEIHTESLSLARESGNRRGEAIILNGIGNLYNRLGDKAKAFEFYNQALSVNKTIGNKQGEGATLSNIGVINADLGNLTKALEFYNQALLLNREVGDKRTEATTLNNIGETYSYLGEKMKALELCRQALSLRRIIGDKGGEAESLNGLGGVYDSLGDKAKALEHFEQSLAIRKAIGDKHGEAGTLHNLMYQFEKQKNPGFAIFYGKQSVNAYQQLRANIQTLDRNWQRGFTKSIDYTYRKLAEILIAEGRIAEAEQVLAMLKDEEYYDYLRKDFTVSAELLAKLSFSPAEAEAIRRYDEIGNKLTALGKEREDLQRERKLFPAEQFPKQARLDEIEKQIDGANKAFSVFLAELKTTFEQKDKHAFTVESPTQTLLKELNQPRSVIISTIVGEDKLLLIVSTQNAAPRAYSVNSKAKDIENLVAEFRAAVKNPAIDPRMVGQKLYQVLFPAPLIKDLETAKVGTLIWSLDGALRYAPLSALWDGRQYLVEKYTNAVITLATKNNLKQSVIERNQ